MSGEIISEATRLYERLNAKYTQNTIRAASADEINQLQMRLGNKVPNWFIELISQVPLIGAEFGFHEFEPAESFDGVSYMIWADPNTIIEESLDYIPGRAIFEHGFICVASCSHGSGDPFFIQIGNDENPKVYRVFHDCGDDSKLILKEGMSLASEKLSDLFKDAVILFYEKYAPQ